MPRVVIISDTHSYHRKLKIPDGDILIHCGDITNRGEISIIEDFADWMNQFSHQKIVIYGNHEVGHSNKESHKRMQGIKALEKANINYLEDSGVEINGLKFWGSPVTKRFFDWEYNRNPGKDIAYHWNLIPENTDVLITHQPPYNILDLVEDNLSNRGRDLHQGCEDLYARIHELPNLKLSCFGHLHLNYGSIKLNCVQFVNASSCTERYEPINKPVVIDL